MVEIQDLRKIIHYLRGIYGIYTPMLVKKNWKITTCNWLDLETHGILTDCTLKSPRKREKERDLQGNSTEDLANIEEDWGRWMTHAKNLACLLGAKDNNHSKKWPKVRRRSTSLHGERERLYYYYKAWLEVRATSHTSQEPWSWKRESPKESVQRPSQDTSKVM